MAGRYYARTMPGNGILSGLTLDADRDPNGDVSFGQDDSPWAQAVREAWLKQLATGLDPQHEKNYPPFPQVNFLDKRGVPAWLDATSIPGSGSSVTLSGSLSDPTSVRSKSLELPDSDAGDLFMPFGADRSSTPSANVVPASYRAGTVPWWAPVGPPDVFGEWRSHAERGLAGLLNYLRQGSGSGGGDPNSPECEQEWQEARELCASELAKPNPSRGITGGYDTVDECARGHVSERCRGNFYERPRYPNTRPYKPR